MLTLFPLSDDPLNAVQLAAEHAPYLQRLIENCGPFESAERLFDQAIQACTTLGGDEVVSGLRLAKKQAHLAIAALDVSGRENLSEVTRRITDFADAATQCALRATLAGRDLSQDGLFLIALGKMGAFELNYSSDIDMAAFFDADRFDGGSREPGDAASRVVRDAMALLSEQTPDGYVFRTDLRLRPDPSSTPLAISTRRAELYYESVGQNWERMVWIKARSAVGDIATGQGFIHALEPFIWRRHLDYWAIADVHAIKNMINAKSGEQMLTSASPDIKLGPGGIREIEFFVQTQQVILGGRNPTLRASGTLEGLEALVELGVVANAVADELAEAYKILRGVEHRIQMLNDEQTHTLPPLEDRRASVAALCGYSSLADFDAGVIEIRRLVHSHYRDLFAEEGHKRARAQEGNLVFTGVDDDPGTVQTLSEYGFEHPSSVIERIRQWHRGRTPATRTTRGRELLTALLPDLLAAMAKTGEPDAAFTRFSKFFEGLRSGVQVLSMLVSETTLLEDLVTTLAIAPRIADGLARRPGLLEALLFVSDRKEAPVLTEETDFESSMDLVRRWHGEQAFLIGHRLLHGLLAAADAASEWSRLADHCIELMADAAARETTRRFGAAPGSWAVIGLGKLGGSEMTAGSDLDLLVIYESSGDGDAQSWFTRFTQRLITALSAETAEGQLYEVDMRLRPSGRAGPVATSLSSFERYHREEAWTWEHMALTRLRPITGDESLSERVVEIASTMIAPQNREQVTSDILDMRSRLHRDKPASGPWDLKMREGGLVDLEFIVQHAILTARTPQPLQPGLAAALQQLQNCGELDNTTCDQLSDAFSYLQSLQQVQRIAVGDSLSEEDISAALADRLCRAVSADTFDALTRRLEATCGALRSLFCKRIGDPATEAAGSSV